MVLHYIQGDNVGLLQVVLPHMVEELVGFENLQTNFSTVLTLIGSFCKLLRK